MAAGRPKVDEEKKLTEVSSIRLSKSQKEEIVLLFGSVKAFLEVAIVTMIEKKKRKKKNEKILNYLDGDSLNKK